MVHSKDNAMGRFSVEVELANNDDLVRAYSGDIPSDQVRRLRIRGVVDSGATRLVLPRKAVDALGLRKSGEVGVRYADGRESNRDLVGGVQLTWGDRGSVFNAVVEPDRDTALIGAIVMEDLDLIVDCIAQTLRPRDPRQIISEVE
jgi:predicted aspartyl protease